MRVPPNHEMSARDRSGQESLDQLRALLLDSERREIEELRERIEEVNALETIIQVDELRARNRELEDRVLELEARILSLPQRAEHVSEILPAAITHRREARGDLTDALRPDIEQALHESIRRDPTVMAEALYPVMGPTIRKLIASMFSLDNMRPGSKYVVSNAYVIDRQTSLPLAVHAPEEAGLEADMVSGMMEALRSFVQDAFEAKEFDGLHDLRVGDVELWIEWGPHAVLAVVVRGIAPEALRMEMQETLERFHATYADELDRFEGDPNPFLPMGADLSELKGRLERIGTPSPVRKFLPLLVIVAVVAAIALLVWVLVA